MQGIEQVVQELRKKGASDLHLEPGLPPTARVLGELKPLEKKPLDARTTREIARSILSGREWELFQDRQAVDLSRVVGGVHCRIHALKTFRGIGLAIRLLSVFQPTLERLNLHPDLAGLLKRLHGLIVVCGPTGSGKSSTLAAMINEINVNECMHIVTLESPIEYFITPKRSFVRQREVGRDTPSFERALIDAMREDPDVIMVGEMRDRETIQLTLNAAETGQLVLTTLHSATAAEAAQRIVSAFPSEIQGAVGSQLADCLIAIVAQRLVYKENYGLRVPVCEILTASHPVKNLIRQGQLFKLASLLETGHNEGCWSFRRYQGWVDSRTGFYIPETPEVFGEGRPRDESSLEAEAPSGPPAAHAPAKSEAGGGIRRGREAEDDVIVIEEPDEKSLGDLLKKITDKKRSDTEKSP